MNSRMTTSPPRPFANEQELFAWRAVVGFTFFSLAAGFVNAGAFMACRSFVTHVTGTVTTAAIGAPDAKLALQPLLLLVAFLIGGVLAVLTAETLRNKPRTAFAIPIVLVMAMLLAIAIGGRTGAFGDFGSDEPATGVRPLPLLLAVAMGALNAAVAVATSNAIRTTHLTGPATDLAGNLVRGALGAGAAAAREWRWALLRAAKIVAFGSGAFFAAKYASILAYDTFLAGAVLLGVATSLTAFTEASPEAPRVSFADPRRLVNGAPSARSTKRSATRDAAAPQ